jgi:hypothetical protein
MGNVFISNYGDNTISRVSASGSVLRMYVNSSFWLAKSDGQRNLYVANNDNDTGSTISLIVPSAGNGFVRF